ncbi:MAG: CDP-alcohol phosphatidyltransferase family protein [Holosporales bacterium]|nr:CDP-alcohol phosphatidyltransferase family protein [Holosporales bacterium]
MLKNYIPNLLCFLRVLCAPAFLFGIAHDHLSSFFIILFAALTDFLDGYLARKFKVESKIGALLDPLADKIFCNTAIWGIYFIKYHSISMFLVSLFLTIRDGALLLGSLLIVSKKFDKKMKPIFISKICTALVFFLCGMSIIHTDTNLIKVTASAMEILSLSCLFSIILTFYLYIRRFYKQSNTNF